MGLAALQAGSSASLCAFWLFVLRPAIGLTGIMHLFKTVRDFGYDFDLWETRLMLTAWAVVIAGAAYFSLWRELILYWLIPYTFIFSTLQLLVRSRRSLQGERGEDALGFELVRQYLHLDTTSATMPYITSTPAFPGSACRRPTAPTRPKSWSR